MVIQVIECRHCQSQNVIRHGKDRTGRQRFRYDVLELDELWSFVARRKNKRWVWLALCRRTRQIVACAVGDTK